MQIQCTTEISTNKYNKSCFVHHVKVFQFFMAGVKQNTILT